MVKVYGDNYISRTQVYMWCKQFRNDREDLNDHQNPGRKSLWNYPSRCKIYSKMLPEVLKSSENTIWRILTEILVENEDQKYERVFARSGTMWLFTISKTKNQY